MVEQTGLHKQAVQHTICMVFFLLMQITGQLLVGLAQSSEPQTVEQTGLHKQAEQQTICVVSPLPMQITGRLLVIMVQSSEPQMEEQTGLHKQAEQQTLCMVSPLQMQITERLLVIDRNNPQNHKRRNKLDFTNKRNNKLFEWCLLYRCK